MKLSTRYLLLLPDKAVNTEVLYASVKEGECFPLGECDATLIPECNGWAVAWWFNGSQFPNNVACIVGDYTCRYGYLGYYVNASTLVLSFTPDSGSV